MQNIFLSKAFFNYAILMRFYVYTKCIHFRKKTLVNFETMICAQKNIEKYPFI